MLAKQWAMTAKALRPLPIAHKPLTEEARVRQRYVDLIVATAGAARWFAPGPPPSQPARLTARRGFIEVETPMLQLLHGGAAARPFVTHSNALDIDLYLRIAPELFLKRAVVGGIDRVFEINRNFRNEGVDSTHSPEFAMLEAYQAYGDYNTMAELTRELVQQAAIAVSGSTRRDPRRRRGVRPGRRLALGDAVRVAFRSARRGGHGPHRWATPASSTRTRLGSRSTRSGARASWPRSCSRSWSCPACARPTFVRDYPEETSPLTRAHRTEPGLVEKWDLYVLGFELATALLRAGRPGGAARASGGPGAAGRAGRREAMRLDEDFLRAMEYGMPPAGGMGMGIDRLLMALTGLGIRETILFPLVRPE